MKTNKKVFLISLLVVGNLIGAGILALPIQTAGAGFIFTSLAMTAFCLAMFFSAYVLADEACEEKDENFNYPSLYGRYLGPFGKWLAVTANLLILYGLLTAYLSGGSAIIISLFDIESSHIQIVRAGIISALFIGLSLFALGGTALIAKYNGWLMIALGATFAGIVVIGAAHVQPRRELFFNYKFLPIAIPVVLTAFHFHNIIPSISRHLDWNLKSISKAMIIGMTLGFLMNLLWVAVGIGVLPLTFGQHSIVHALEHGLPATVPISKILNTPLFSVLATTFAIVAICTSYIANGMGLMDFNKDLFSSDKTSSPKKALVATATFIPPLVIALFFPNVFLCAIGIVGGVGIAILFGILPAIVHFIKHKSLKKRITATLIIILFLAALAADLANDFGFIDTKTAIAELRKKSPEQGKR
ncbi:MAG: hypothetical protein KAG97_06360 [Victivallales bacterium]|nr:hypothetical protein [Victivallales bacterium]